MLRLRALPLALLLAAPAVAQYSGQSDADALAEQVRRLGSSPQDLDALLTAGEISLRLEDWSAAAAFFARAEKVQPDAPRAKAGEASIVLHAERPVESLRLFQQAEQLGVPAARLAAERGLAYDLIGDPGRAERQYQLALAGREDAEARRRYALSLAIAGQQARALAALDPLIRTNDRAAWRSRAFVLAMGGDTAGATRIAETMMPPGAATALQGFFAQLPRLSPVDKAFAVHFGEVQATPQRLADARLPREAPLPLAPLAVQPVQVAAVQQPAKTKRDRKRREQEVAMIAAAPSSPPPPPPLPAVPTYQAPAYTPPAAATPTRDRPLSAGEQAALAAVGNRAARVRGSRAAPAPPVVARALSPDEQRSLAAASGSRDGTTSHLPDTRAAQANATRPPQVASTPIIASNPAPFPEVASRQPPSPVPPTVARSLTTDEQASLAAAAGPPPQPPAPTPGFSTTRTDIARAPVAVVPPGATAAPPRVVAAPPPPPVRTVAPPTRTPVVPPRAVRRSFAQADSVLSRIVAGLSVPASELEVATPPTAAERRAAERKAAADKKALADKKAAAAAKAEADRAAAEEQRAARAEPARIWVQVGGGANEAALGLSWRTIAAKAPQAFAGRQGWTTPLRATNRILAGPFKSDADARAFVNQLAKAGLSSFTFTSEAGQKVTRLATK